jgi:hypothetical protein
MEKAFWRFVDQKWRDSLNVAVAEPQSMDHAQETRKSVLESTKRLDGS